MAWGEPKWKTMERMKRLTQQYPELDFSTPDRVMETDNDNLTNHTAPVSQFSQDVMQLGAYAAQQHTDLLQHEAQSYGNPDSQLPDFGNTGSIYDESEFKPRTWQDAASPLDLIAPGSIGGEVLTHLDRPRGAAAGFATSGDRYGWGAAGEALEGFKNPGEYQGRDTQFAQMLPDNDVLGPLSVRDIAGGIGDQVFDPTNYVPIGAADELGDVARTATRGRTAFESIPDAATAGSRLTPQPIGGGSPISEVLSKIIPGEPVPTGLLRMYEGRTNTQGLFLSRDLDEGNALLEAVGIGKPAARGRVVQRTPDVEELFKALHGEGEVPLRLKPAYDDLKAMIAAETQASLDFDPKFMARPEYFPRGWKAPKETKFGAGRMGAKPGFKKARNDATFTQMLEDGWEPVSWNPYEMVALRRVAGAEFREQTDLVKYLQDAQVALKADGPVPDGYRIPRVGPAFEGKPRLAPGEDGATNFFGFTDRWAVPDHLADTLENMYGSPMSLGKLGPVDVLGTIRTVGQVSKRAKLFGSLFQQVDFSTRTGFSTFGGAVNSLLRGHPIEAVSKAITLPSDIGKLAYANVSSGRRQALRDQILSGEVLFKDRPGITLKGVSEAGWSQRDISILPRDIKTMLDGVDTPRGLPKAMLGSVTRNFGRLEDAMQNGLFDGVYPQAQILALKKQVLPEIMRAHPDWTDAQVMGSAATEVNKMFSTLGNFQTVFNNRGMRELARNLIFSTNEPEALIKGAFSTVKGPNKSLWVGNYVGGALFLAAVANALHFTATGEFLPLDRYRPLNVNLPGDKFDSITGADQAKFGPLPIGYNSNAFSPDIPGLKGRNGTQLSVDLMGQMDTVFRVLDPKSFVTNRFSTPVRAAQNQLQGEDFYGRELQSPLDRLGQAASDLIAPIGAGNVLGALDIGPENEGRLGTAGQLVQASGLNLNAETNRELRDRKALELAESGVTKPDGSPITSWNDLTPRQKKEIEETNPEFKAEIEERQETAAERGDEFALRSARADEIQAEINAQQLVDDERLEKDPFFATQYRENTSKRQRELAIRKDEIYEGQDFKEGSWPILDQYFKLLDEAELPNGDLDFEKVDAWRATLTPEQDKFIDDQTGINKTPKAQELRDDRRAIEESGYWDIRDEVFDYFLESQGMAKGSYKFDDFWSEVQKQYRAYAIDYLDQQNPNWRQTSPQADVLLAQAEADRLRGKFDQGLGEARKQWLSGHMDVYQLLTKWGYRTPGKEEALNYAGVGG